MASSPTPVIPPPPDGFNFDAPPPVSTAGRIPPPPDGFNFDAPPESVPMPGTTAGMVPPPGPDLPPLPGLTDRPKTFAEARQYAPPGGIETKPLFDLRTPEQQHAPDAGKANPVSALGVPDVLPADLPALQRIYSGEDVANQIPHPAPVPAVPESRRPTGQNPVASLGIPDIQPEDLPAMTQGTKHVMAGVGRGLARFTSPESAVQIAALGAAGKAIPALANLPQVAERLKHLPAVMKALDVASQAAVPGAVALHGGAQLVSNGMPKTLEDAGEAALNALILGAGAYGAIEAGRNVLSGYEMPEIPKETQARAAATGGIPEAVTREQAAANAFALQSEGLNLRAGAWRKIAEDGTEPIPVATATNGIVFVHPKQMIGTGRKAVSLVRVTTTPDGSLPLTKVSEGGTLITAGTPESVGSWLSQRITRVPTGESGASLVFEAGKAGDPARDPIRPLLPRLEVAKHGSLVAGRGVATIAAGDIQPGALMKTADGTNLEIHGIDADGSVLFSAKTDGGEHISTGTTSVDSLLNIINGKQNAVLSAADVLPGASFPTADGPVRVRSVANNIVTYEATDGRVIPLPIKRFLGLVTPAPQQQEGQEGAPEAEQAPVFDHPAYVKALTAWHTAGVKAATALMAENPAMTLDQANQAVAGTFGAEPKREDFRMLPPEAEDQKPEKEEKPEKPTKVHTVGPETPNAPTAAEKTEPESPETIAIQMEQLGAGIRRVVMFPGGQGQPAPGQYPDKVAVVADGLGNTYAYRTDLTDEGAIKSAAHGNTLPALLGHATLGMGTVDKRQLQGELIAVVVKDARGVEVQTTVTDAAHFAQTLVASQALMPPGGSVEHGSPEQALAGRTGAAEAPPAVAPLGQVAPISGAPAQPEEVPVVTGKDVQDQFTKAVDLSGKTDAEIDQIADILGIPRKPQPVELPATIKFVKGKDSSPLQSVWFETKEAMDEALSPWQALGTWTITPTSGIIGYQSQIATADLSDIGKATVEAERTRPRKVTQYEQSQSDEFQKAFETTPITEDEWGKVLAYVTDPKNTGKEISPFLISSVAGLTSDRPNLNEAVFGRLLHEGLVGRKPDGFGYVNLAEPSPEKLADRDAENLERLPGAIRKYFADIEAINKQIAKELAIPAEKRNTKASQKRLDKWRRQLRQTTRDLGRARSALRKLDPDAPEVQRGWKPEPPPKPAEEPGALTSHERIMAGYDYLKSLPQNADKWSFGIDYYQWMLGIAETKPVPGSVPFYQDFPQAEADDVIRHLEEIIGAPRAITKKTKEQEAENATRATLKYPLTYFTGSSGPAVEARANDRGDIGLMLTPLKPDYINKAEHYPVIAIDNGAFSAVTPFSAENFLKLLDRVAALPEVARKVIFVVAPDVVRRVGNDAFGDAAATLAQFPEWAAQIKARGLPVALAAQNGLEDMLEQIPWDSFDVLFMAGSTDWKLGRFPEDQKEQKAKWKALIHAAFEHGKSIHVGRVNSFKRADYANFNMGAVSVDGTHLKHDPEKGLARIESWLNRINNRDDADGPKYPDPRPRDADADGAEDPMQFTNDSGWNNGFWESRNGRFRIFEGGAGDGAFVLQDMDDEDRKDTHHSSMKAAIAAARKIYKAAEPETPADAEATPDAPAALPPLTNPANVMAAGDYVRGMEPSPNKDFARDYLQWMVGTRDEKPQPGQPYKIGSGPAESIIAALEQRIGGKKAVMPKDRKAAETPDQEQEPEELTGKALLDKQRADLEDRFPVGAVIEWKADGRQHTATVTGLDEKSSFAGGVSFMIMAREGRKNVLVYPNGVKVKESPVKSLAIPVGSRVNVNLHDGKGDSYGSVVGHGIGKYKILFDDGRAWEVKAADVHLASQEPLTPPAADSEPAEHVQADAFPPAIEEAPKDEPGQIRLANSALRILQNGGGFGNNVTFQQLADAAFGGSRAAGKYDMKQAYDALEAAVNRYFADSIGADLLIADPRFALGQLRELMGKLPTQNIRTQNQELLQQFSTPPTLSFLVAKLAAILPSDTVLEPSAGTASLASWAKAAGAIVHGNEIDPKRADLYHYVMRGEKPTTVNAEYLHAMLPPEIRPTVIIMNPPFSATGGRLASNSNAFGYAHVLQAFKRLKPGGRLVAILGEGAKMAGMFEKAGGLLRANIGIEGEYAKYGTTFGNRILVVDKISAVDLIEQLGQPIETVTGDYNKVEDAYDALRPIIAQRPVVPGLAEVGGSVLGTGGSRTPVDGERGGGTESAGAGQAGTGVSESGPRNDVSADDGEESGSRSEEQPAAENSGGDADSSSGSGVTGDAAAAAGLTREELTSAADELLAELAAGEDETESAPETEPEPAPAPEGEATADVLRILSSGPIHSSDIAKRFGAESDQPWTGLRAALIELVDNGRVVIESRGGQNVYRLSTVQPTPAPAPADAKITDAKRAQVLRWMQPLDDKNQWAELTPPKLAARYPANLIADLKDNGYIGLFQGTHYGVTAIGTQWLKARSQKPEPAPAPAPAPDGRDILTEQAARGILAEIKDHGGKFWETDKTPGERSVAYSFAGKTSTSGQFREIGPDQWVREELVAPPAPKPPQNAPAPAPAPPKKLTMGERLQQAKERELQKLRDKYVKNTTLNMGVDPEDLKSLVIIGAANIYQGAVKFTDWAKKLREDLGDVADRIAKAINKTVGQIFREVHGYAAESAAKFGKKAEATPDEYEEETESSDSDSAQQPLRPEDRISLESRKQEDLMKRVEDDSSYLEYVPAIEGLAHPGRLVETKVMASVDAPRVTYSPNLPANIKPPKPLSAAQLEAVARAGMMHQTFNEDGARMGYLMGDGTGVGKGQQIAAIIWDRYRSGQKKAIWISASAGLAKPAKGDFLGIGAKDLAGKLYPINDWKPGEKINIKEGVLFSTYMSLIAREQRVNGRTRLQQIQDWAGTDDLVIIFDEGQSAKNAVAAGQTQNSKTGMAVVQLQQEMPGAYVVYASATAATDVNNLGYMTRMGLWGKGTPFHQGFGHFMNEVGRGGIAAMELIAREMKAMGRYLSRSISYKGVTYDEYVHELTPEQREMYDEAAAGWQKMMSLAKEQIKENGAAGTSEMGDLNRAFWTNHQRFFRQLLTAMKVPSVLELADKALAENKSVVISLIGTGAAQADRALASAAAEAEDDLDFSPKEILLNLIRESYPTTMYEEYTDEHGKRAKRPVLGPDGKVQSNPDAVIARDELIADLDKKLALPENPLDFIIKTYGREAVAELTSRKWTPGSKIVDGKTVWDKVTRAPEGVPMKKVNEHEMEQFQSGKKRIAIISKASGAGFSLHADLAAKNQQPRFHIVMELSWSADSQIQSFGRTHRSNQKQPPEYVIVSTDAGGEKRFSSTIARRLESLGALTKGQRDASGSGGVLAKYNFETDQGVQAATSFYTQLLSRSDEMQELFGISGHDILRQMGVLQEPVDDDGRPTKAPYMKPEDYGNVTRLLNRILNIKIGEQNAVFNHFFDIFNDAVSRAIESGTLDTGVNMVRGDHVRLKEQKEIAKDPASGAKTYRYVVEAERRNKPVPPRVPMELQTRNRGRMFRRREFRGATEPHQLLWVEKSRTPMTTRGGAVERAYNTFGPEHRETDNAHERISQSDLHQTWEPIEGYERLREVGELDKSIPELQKRVKENEGKEDYYAKLYRRSLEEQMQKRNKLLAEMATAKATQFDLWQQAYDAAPQSRTERIDMIGGSVLRVWPLLRVGNGRMDIRIAYPESGGSITGVAMTEGDANAVEQSLTGQTVVRSANSVFQAIIAGKEEFRLTGGVRLAQGRINREPVVEAFTNDRNNENFLRQAGLQSERVGWRYRYYIPNDAALALPLIEKILKQFPIQQREGEAPLFRPKVNFDGAAPTWYSQLQRAIEDKMPNKASPAQVAAIVGNPQSGVKDDEVKWTGLMPWLRDQSGSVTKPEVLEFLRTNAVKVEESLHGGPTRPVDPDRAGQRAAIKAREEELKEQLRSYGLPATTNEEGRYGWDLVLTQDLAEVQRELRDFDRGGDPRSLRENQAERRRLMEQFRLSDTLPPDFDLTVTRNRLEGERLTKLFAPTKFSKYTTPGGREYGELLLTLPLADAGKWVVFNVTDGPSGGPAVGVFASAEDARADAEQRGRDFSYGMRGERDGVYTSSHWDEKNVVAHIRFTTRTGADKKRVFHIEEIQSDWHQQGRDKGYRAEGEERARLEKEIKAAEQALTEKNDARHDALEAYKNMVRPNRADLTAAQSELVRARLESDAAVANLTAMKKRLNTAGVPNAPFSKTWHELAFRRALRWAAENGFDRVTWTTGEQQAGRYDLSKQVSKVTWLPAKKAGPPTWTSADTAPEGGIFAAYDLHDAPVVSKHIDESDLPDYVGKDVARKLLETAPDYEGGPHVLEGDNLQVGGHGMNEFYDTILPRYAAKLGAKWGAKVTKSEVRTKPKSGERYFEPDLSYEQVHAIAKKAATEENWEHRNRNIFVIEEHMRGGMDFQTAMSEMSDFAVHAGGLAERLGVTAKTRKVQQTETVHSMDITPKMFESVMSGQPLFRPVDLKDWRKGRTAGEQLALADAKYEELTPGHGHIYANEPAMLILKTALDVTTRFQGVTLPMLPARDVYLKLGHMADETKDPVFAAAVRNIMTQMDLAGPIKTFVNAGPEVPASEIQATRREEAFHRAQLIATYGRKEPVDLEALLGKSAQLKNALRVYKTLDRSKEAETPQDEMHEVAAMLASAQLKPLHMSPLQAAAALKDYVDHISARHGADNAAELLDYIQPAIRKAMGANYAVFKRRGRASDSALYASYSGPTRRDAGYRRIPGGERDNEGIPAKSSGGRESERQGTLFRPARKAVDPSDPRAGTSPALSDLIKSLAEIGKKKPYSKVTVKTPSGEVTTETGDKPEEDPGRHHYTQASALSRIFLPGRHLAEVKAANPAVYDAAVLAGSSRSVTSAIAQAMVLIRQELKDSGTGITIQQLFSAYQESRLQSIAARYERWADETNRMDDEETQAAVSTTFPNGQSTLLQMLDLLDDKLFDLDVSQSAMKAVADQDWPLLRAIADQAFTTAADRVVHTLEPQEYSYITAAIKNDDQVKQADRIYGDFVEDEIAAAHARHDGIFAEDLGDLNRYFPLLAEGKNLKKTTGGKRDFPYKAPANRNNYMAMGMSSHGYTTDLPTFAKHLGASLRGSSVANLLKILDEEGWTAPLPDEWDGRFLGPDGIVYKGIRKTVSPSRVIVNNKNAIHTKASHIVMPLFMSEGLGHILDNQPMMQTDLGKVARWLNMLSTKALPFELVYHSTGYFGALYGNTPFLSGDTKMKKILTAPIVKAFYLRYNMAATNPSSPENVKKLIRIAKLGALPAHTNSVTADRAMAEITGAKREPFSWGTALYGPNGFDARARIMMYDLALAHDPNMSDQDLGDFINQLGQYGPEFQSAVEDFLKRSGIGPFATAGMTRLVNGFHALTGTGPMPERGGGKGMGKKALRAMDWAVRSALVMGTALYILGYKALTGKWPGQDSRFKMWRIPVGGSNATGWIDQFRHSKAGDLQWGKGNEVGYINIAPAIGPLAQRATPNTAINRWMHGGSAEQILNGAVADGVNALLHPALGPLTKAGLIAIADAHPYLMDLVDDRGRYSPQFMSAQPKLIKPGFVGGLMPSLSDKAPVKNPGFAGRSGARVASAIKDLSSTAALLGETTGTLGDDEKNGSTMFRFMTSMVFPGMIPVGGFDNSSNPYAAENHLMRQKKTLAGLSLPEALKVYDAANPAERRDLYREVKDKVFSARDKPEAWGKSGEARSLAKQYFGLQFRPPAASLFGAPAPLQ